MATAFIEYRPPFLFSSENLKILCCQPVRPNNNSSPAQKVSAHSSECLRRFYSNHLRRCRRQRHAFRQFRKFFLFLKNFYVGRCGRTTTLDARQKVATPSSERLKRFDSVRHRHSLVNGPIRAIFVPFGKTFIASERRSSGQTSMPPPPKELKSSLIIN